MRPRRSWLVLAAVVLLPARAGAERHNWEITAGFSRVERSALWGGILGGAKVFEKLNLSVFVDFGKNSGPHGGAALTQTSLMGGGRWWPFGLKTPTTTARTEKPLQPFVHVLLGGTQSKTRSVGDDTAFSWGGGAGLDALFSSHGGVRGQVDFLRYRPGGLNEDFARYSVGLIYRFERK